MNIEGLIQIFVSLRKYIVTGVRPVTILGPISYYYVLILQPKQTKPSNSPVDLEHASTNDKSEKKDQDDHTDFSTTSTDTDLNVIILT